MVITILPLLCGRITIERGVFTGREDDGCWDLPVLSYLIRHHKGNILFDTGLPLGLPETGKSIENMPGVTIFPITDDGIAGGLLREGYYPEDIKMVVNSHLHLDHAGGNNLFPYAIFYIQRVELETTVTECTYNQRAFGPHSQFYQVTGDLDIFGDGTCCILETSGHSAGHQSLFVRSPYGKAVLVGDACFRPENLKDYLIPLIVRNRQKALHSVSRLRNIAMAERAVVLTAHDPTFKLTRR